MRRIGKSNDKKTRERKKEIEERRRKRYSKFNRCSARVDTTKKHFEINSMNQSNEKYSSIAVIVHKKIHSPNTRIRHENETQKPQAANAECA